MQIIGCDTMVNAVAVQDLPSLSQKSKATTIIASLFDDYSCRRLAMKEEDQSLSF